VGLSNIFKQRAEEGAERALTGKVRVVASWGDCSEPSFLPSAPFLTPVSCRGQERNGDTWPAIFKGLESS